MFTTGTANGHADLLDKLRQWLTTPAPTGPGWTQLSWGAVPGDSSDQVLFVQGPGAGTGRETYLKLYTQTNATASYYSICITGAIGYQAGAMWNSQPGEGPVVCLNLWQNAISYWFYANDRRVIIIAKCSTNYMSAYAGMFLPWALPTQYSFPLYIAADYGALAAWNYADAGRRMFCDPGQANPSGGQWLSAGVVRDPDGTWNNVLNQQHGAQNDYTYGYNRAGAYFVWPFAGANDNATSQPSWAGPTNGMSGGQGVVDLLVPTAQSERIILPVHINHTQQVMLGALDGVYMPLGSGLATEQTVTAGSKTLRAFQNIQRNSANDFFLIDEA